MICSLYFVIFGIFYPQNYLGFFLQGQFHLPTTRSFLWRQGIKLEVLLGFESFQIVAHGFLGCQFLEKCRIVHFGQFFKSKKKKKKKKNSGYFAITEYIISRHISMCTLRIYIVLHGYKLFLTSYVWFKNQKCKICAIFLFLSFLAHLEKQ